jgi:lysophospholipase L1-like esterase
MPRVRRSKYGNEAVDNAQLASSLAHKAAKTEARLKIEKLSQTDMTEEFLQQMAGTTPINAVPARKSVGLEKLSWLDVINLNLHNVSTDIAGSLIDNANGSLFANASFRASEFIPVESGKPYYNSNALNMAFYDVNKVFISGFAGGGFTNPYTTPANAKYVRHTYFNGENGVLCEGTTMIKSTAVYGERIVNLVDSDFEEIIVDTANENLVLKEKSVSIENLDFANIVRLNLHDAATDIQNAYIDGIGGVIPYDGAWKASDFIPVQVGKTYTNSGTLTSCYYNESKTFVSEIPLTTSKTYTVPNGVAYVRHTYYESEYGVLCEGTSIINPDAVYGDTQASASEEFNNLVASSVSATSPTEGEKMLLFGDSITETHVVSQDGLTHTFAHTNWITYANEILKAEVINFACSGASYKDRPNLTFYQWISNQISVATSVVTNPDIVVISAGTNDDTYNLGDFETAMAKTSLNSLDRLNSYYEAIRWAFWKLRLSYPNATFYCGIPLQRADFTPQYMEPNTNALLQMAKRYNFIIIDGMNESGIVRDFEVNGGEGLFLSDGLHPNTAGKQKQGKFYANVIKNTYMA